MIRVVCIKSHKNFKFGYPYDVHHIGNLFYTSNFESGYVESIDIEKFLTVEKFKLFKIKKLLNR